MAKHAIKLCMKVVSMKLLHHAESHTKRYREIIVNENIHHFPGKRSIRQIKTNHKGTEGTIQGGCLRVCGADKVSVSKRSYVYSELYVYSSRMLVKESRQNCRLS
ncbi:hypothetical protein AR441_00525 [Bacillus velezensis]|nr:hypothetical protein AR441_00525 [Bacillus velezensis]